MPQPVLAAALRADPPATDLPVNAFRAGRPRSHLGSCIVCPIAAMALPHRLACPGMALGGCRRGSRNTSDA